jgi:hypothetical protein
MPGWINPEPYNQQMISNSVPNGSTTGQERTFWYMIGFLVRKMLYFVSYFLIKFVTVGRYEITGLCLPPVLVFSSGTKHNGTNRG